MRPLLLLAIGVSIAAAAEPPRELARSILAELISINTTDSEGDNTKAAEAVARRLLAAGFPAQDVQVVVPAPMKGNIVARLRGSGKGKPVLFIAHLDVVEAKRSDWTVDPFTLTEKDGYFYGRGTQDIKGDASLLVANFIRLKQENYRPERDMILALTADEEGGRGPNGVQWLLANRRDLIDAEFCVNADSGGGQFKDGKRLLYAVQAAEKGYSTFLLRATNPGGHSSLPSPDNAIYHLADALARIRELQFPERLNPITNAFFDRMASIDPGAAASPSPYYNALRRTTCIPTMLSGGHAENALPQTAEAKVNCRLVPGDTVDAVAAVLHKTLAGTGVEIRSLHPATANPFFAFACPAACRPGVRRPLDVARLARRARDGDGRDRCEALARCRHSNLRHVRNVHRHQRYPRARKRRAHPGPVVLRRPRVLVSADEADVAGPAVASLQPAARPYPRLALLTPSRNRFSMVHSWRHAKGVTQL